VLEWASRYRATLENWGKAPEKEVEIAKNALKETLGIPKELYLTLAMNAGSAITSTEGLQVVLGTLYVRNDLHRDEIWNERMKVKYDSSRPMAEQDAVARREAELETKYWEALIGQKSIPIPLEISLESGEVTFEGTPVIGKADISRQIEQIAKEPLVKLIPLEFHLNTDADIYVDMRTTRKGERWEVQSFDSSLFTPTAKEFGSESVEPSELERRAEVRKWKLSYRDLDEGGRLCESSGGIFYQASPGEPFRRCLGWSVPGQYRGDPSHSYCYTPAGHVYHVSREISIEEIAAGDKVDPAKFFYKMEKGDTF
jgi:hypothetical protein